MMAGDPELIAALKKLRPSVGVASPAFVQERRRRGLVGTTGTWRSGAASSARKRALFEESLRTGRA